MTFAHNLRFGLRTLRKSPGFGLTAVITMALGIGATTAIFSVSDAMLWKPIPLPHLDTLVTVMERDHEDPGDFNGLTSKLDYLRNEHVNEAQGFLLARPLDPQTLETQLLAPTRARSPATNSGLGRSRRDANRRYYDLLERLLPADLLAHKVPLEEQLRHKLLSRYRAHGLLGVSGGGDVLGGLGPAKPDTRWPGYPGRNALREELVERGDLVSVEVEGVRGKRLLVSEEVKLLEAPPNPPPSVAFVPPFDPIVWDRRLLGSLFEFEYVWELFLPPAKRRWGWYVLPIVFRDRFVGRIEPRIDRAEARVQVLDVWWEDGFSPRRADGFVDAMRDALRSYLGFAGADRLAWAPHLGAEKRLFLTQP